MLVHEIMTSHPSCIHIDSTIGRGAEIIAVDCTSELMVVDHQHRLVGVISEYDLIQPLLPNIDEVVQLGGSLEDAVSFFEHKGIESACYPIAPLVHKCPIVVKPSDEVFYAATILLQNKLRHLPVVVGDYLVGTVSQTEVCKKMISSYCTLCKHNNKVSPNVAVRALLPTVQVRPLHEKYKLSKGLNIHPGREVAPKY